MKGRSCRVCGGAIGRGETSCPHCGTRVGTGISRVWVLTFFVMGVALGLMLLILQQQGLPEWLNLTATPSAAQPAATKSPAPAQSKVRSVERPRPRTVQPK